MELQERYKKVTLALPSLMIIRKEEEVEEEEEGEEDEEEEEKEDEQDLQGTYADGKIFHFSFCFACFFQRLALISSSSVTIFDSK